MNIVNRFFRKNKYHFVHVPKCAGTAIKKNIELSSFSHLFSFSGHEASACEARNKMVIASVRSPLSFYVSVYNQKMNTSQEKQASGKSYPTMHNNSFRDFFEDVIVRRNGFDGYKRWFKPLKQHHIQMYEYADNIGWYSAVLIWYAMAGNDDTINEFKKEKLSVDSLLMNSCLDLIVRVEYLQKDFDSIFNPLGVRVDFSNRVNSIGDDIKIHNPGRLFLGSHIGDIDREIVDEIIDRDRMFIGLYASDGLEKINRLRLSD